MAPVFTLFISQPFICYETEFQAALVITEKGGPQEISTKDDNSTAKRETKKETALPNKLKLASSLHKSKSILESKRKIIIFGIATTIGTSNKNIRVTFLRSLQQKIVFCASTIAQWFASPITNWVFGGKLNRWRPFGMRIDRNMLAVS